MVAIEHRIAALEERMSEIERRLGNPVLYQDGCRRDVHALGAERETAQEEVGVLYKQWERVGEELAGV